jgi:hypothetical protein
LLSAYLALTSEDMKFSLCPNTSLFRNSVAASRFSSAVSVTSAADISGIFSRGIAIHGWPICQADPGAISATSAGLVPRSATFFSVVMWNQSLVSENP